MHVHDHLPANVVYIRPLCPGEELVKFLPEGANYVALDFRGELLGFAEEYKELRRTAEASGQLVYTLH